MSQTWQATQFFIVKKVSHIITTPHTGRPQIPHALFMIWMKLKRIILQ